MKTYKVFILEKGSLKSVFMGYIFKKGMNIKEKDTPGFFSWTRKKDAERYKETLVARFFRTVVIKEVGVELCDIKTQKRRLYTKTAQKKLKIKKPYGEEVCSNQITIL